MGILNSAARTARRLFSGKSLNSSLGEKIRGSKLNTGSWGEDIARGLGINTRTRTKIGTRNLSGMDNAGRSVEASAYPRVEQAMYDNKLNGAGWAAQGLGGGLGLAAAGTLGAKMISGTEPSHDENGVKTGMHNEERSNAREKFQKEKMGGVNKFNNALLEHNSKDSQWVKTAIKGLGMEKYKKWRAAVAEDPSKSGALHAALISELAKVGDDEMMKQAASEPYVLPGLAKVGDNARRVIVMSPQKGKDKKTTYAALQYDYDEGDDQ